MEFLKANGIDDPNLHMKDTSYEDILEQQEIMNDELETFTRKDKQKDVSCQKLKIILCFNAFCIFCGIVLNLSFHFRVV